MMFQYGNEAWISIEAMSRTSMQSKSDHVWILLCGYQGQKESVFCLWSALWDRNASPFKKGATFILCLL